MDKWYRVRVGVRVRVRVRQGIHSSFLLRFFFPSFFVYLSFILTLNKALIPALNKALIPALNKGVCTFIFVTDGMPYLWFV